MPRAPRAEKYKLCKKHRMCWSVYGSVVYVSNFVIFRVLALINCTPSSCQKPCVPIHVNIRTQNGWKSGSRTSSENNRSVHIYIIYIYCIYIMYIYNVYVYYTCPKLISTTYCWLFMTWALGRLEPGFRHTHVFETPRSPTNPHRLRTNRKHVMHT